MLTGVVFIIAATVQAANGLLQAWYLRDAMNRGRTRWVMWFVATTFACTLTAAWFVYEAIVALI